MRERRHLLPPPHQVRAELPPEGTQDWQTKGRLLCFLSDSSIQVCENCGTEFKGNSRNMKQHLELNKTVSCRRFGPIVIILHLNLLQVWQGFPWLLSPAEAHQNGARACPGFCVRCNLASHQGRSSRVPTPDPGEGGGGARCPPGQEEEGLPAPQGEDELPEEGGQGGGGAPGRHHPRGELAMVGHAMVWRAHALVGRDVGPKSIPTKT